MDAELSAALTMLEQVDPNDLEAHRAAFWRMYEGRTWHVADDVDVSTLRPGPSRRSPPVPVRVYRNRRLSLSSPTLLWFHSGAFALGFAAIDDDLCTRLASAVDYVVVSPDYRLAPEHPFPAGFEDCYATYKWILAFPEVVGADTDRVVIGGGSAGAGLAACLCIRLRDEHDSHVVQQLLACPVIDDRMATKSMQRFVGTPVLDRGQVELMWSRYLRGWDGPVPEYAAAGRAQDLRGLPPAYILTAEEDPLRDEGLEYARRLLDAGNSVELHHFAGTFHSFDTVVPTASVSQKAFAEYVDVLRRAARSYSAVRGAQG